MMRLNQKFGLHVKMNIDKTYQKQCMIWPLVEQTHALMNKNTD